jgi:threonine synthase
MPVKGVNMKNKFFLKCITCNMEYYLEKDMYTCPKCGPDKGILFVIYDYLDISKKYKKDELKNRFSEGERRFNFILPPENEKNYPPLRVGSTALYKNENLNRLLELNELYLKDESTNPSASFKDRASFVGIAMMRELKKERIACASTGNAASSLACLSASLGIKPVIFIPQTAPMGKIAQLIAFGAEVFKLKAPYDDVFDFCTKACEKYGWYNRNTGMNPYLLEGKKTCALELAHQLNFADIDKVFISVGDGCIYSGLFKGFSDLKELGWIEKIPQLIGVQAEGSAPLVKAQKTGDIVPIDAKTVADSICVGYPRAGYAALKAQRESNGEFISVTDDEILKALKYLAENSGVFSEPAGSAAFAGFMKMHKEGKIKKDEKVVVLLTGSGLKDPKAVLNMGFDPIEIPLNINELDKYAEKK